MVAKCVMFERWKNTMVMPDDSQLVPHIVFFRNAGITLLALAVALGAFSVVGSLKATSPMKLAQAVDGMESH
jgi:hypothetical protein